VVKNLLNLFFPTVCEACQKLLSDNEKVLCTECRHTLPVTNFHFDDPEAVKKILYGRVLLENATALLHFSKKSTVQQLLHNLKYRGHENISGFLGRWLGSELKALNNYKTVDVVVPVPLYKTKQRQRGYNQVDLFGREIARCLEVEYNTSVLIKTKPTATQVFKTRLKRWTEDTSLFSLSDTTSLKGKHILIVDDLITTGATIEACASVLHTIDDIKLSLATMAIAD
jgi:ComF family protein